MPQSPLAWYRLFGPSPLRHRF